MREVGFYYGAMYASYGLNILLGGILLFITEGIFDWNIVNFLYLFIISAIVLGPWLYRTGRLVWINIFVGPRQ